MQHKHRERGRGREEAIQCLKIKTFLLPQEQVWKILCVKPCVGEWHVSGSFCSESMEEGGQQRCFRGLWVRPGAFLPLPHSMDHTSVVQYRERKEHFCWEEAVSFVTIIYLYLFCMNKKHFKLAYNLKQRGKHDRPKDPACTLGKETVFISFHSNVLWENILWEQEASQDGFFALIIPIWTEPHAKHRRNVSVFLNDLNRCTPSHAFNPF